MHDTVGIIYQFPPSKFQGIEDAISSTSLLDGDRDKQGPHHKRSCRKKIVNVARVYEKFD